MKVFKVILKFFLVLARVFISEEKKPGSPCLHTSESVKPTSPGSSSDSSSPG